MLTPAHLTAGRSDPHPGVRPGVAEGAAEGVAPARSACAGDQMSRGEERRLRFRALGVLSW